MLRRRFFYLLVMVCFLLGFMGPAQVLAAQPVEAPAASPQASSVTLDDDVSSGTDHDVDTISVNHTTGTGTNRLMLVAVSANNYTTAFNIDSVTFTYGSTELALTEVGTAGDTGRKTAIYRLLEPPSGQSGTVTVDFSATIAYSIVVGVANFEGVDQTTPLGAFAGTTGNWSGGGASLEVSGLDGDELVFDSMYGGGSSSPVMTAGVDQTELWNVQGDENLSGAGSTKQATGSPFTMSWTSDLTSGVWILGAVPIKPATSTDPTISLEGVPLSAFSSSPGTPSAEQSYLVSGVNLTADIVITPPADFEISTTSGSGFVANPNTITLTQTGGEVSSTPVYVRFNRATQGTSGGNITHTSTGATQKDVAVSGSATYCVKRSIGQSSDDAYQANTAVTINSTTLAAYVSSVRRYWGLRFENITVPQNATITSASVTFRAAAAGTGTPTMTLWGEASDNATTFTTAASSISSRPQTSTVSWSMTAWTSGQDYTTASLVTPVQEIVNRSGWASGNGLVIMGQLITSSPANRTVVAWDDTTQANEASLTICYTPPGPTYNLTMAVDPAEGGTTTPSVGVHTYAQDSVVPISATPTEGYEFSHWTPDDTPGDPIADPYAASTTVTMDADYTVTAHFTALPLYTLTVGTTGSGSVTLDPAGDTHYEGTTVTLTPVPDACYAFNGWSGTNSGDILGTGPYTIVMNENKSVTADFTALPPGTPCYRVNAGGDTLDMVPDPDFFALHYSNLSAIPGLTVSNVSGERSTTNTIDMSNVDPSLPMALFQTVLYRDADLSAMTFNFAVPNGEYTVLLHEAEHNFATAGQREFDITVEDALVFDNYDPFVAAGGQNKAVTEHVLTPVSDGVLTIAFTPVVSVAVIRGIEIVRVPEPGTIIVEKQTDPDGATDSFTFTGNASGSIKDNEQIVVADLAPGVYTVQETVPDGWALADIVCDDANSIENPLAAEAEFHLEAGETVKCTFYNELQVDFGDAPDSYQTVLASNGARHVIIPNLHMGLTVDAEPEGQPTPLADGDDLNPLAGPNDEDGVTLPATLAAGDPAMAVTVDGGPSGGKLDAWIDFNGSGAFDNPAEHLWSGVSQTLSPGPNPLTFAVPAGAKLGPTYARFRLSTAGSLPPFGPADNGEVEDYLVQIVDATPPETTLDSSPPDPSGSVDATFTFSSSEVGSIFACKLDAEEFAACSSPKDYTGLAEGSHTFQVRAADAAGNTDLTPASYTWTVDTLTPALAYVVANTTLVGDLDALTATFPPSIPAVIVAEPYKINSRMTLADALPAGSTVSIQITVNGSGPYPYVTDAPIPASPFWVTDLFAPTAAATDFDAGYGGRTELYSITINSGGGNPETINTTVKIESIISKDDFANNDVLAEITLPVVVVSAPVVFIGPTQLSWDPVANAMSYLVYESTTDPYCEPGDVGCVSSEEDSPYTLPTDTSFNYYYFVRTVNGPVQSDNSNRVGRFSFQLVPGTEP